jgi:hypothetical protein
LSLAKGEKTVKVGRELMTCMYPKYFTAPSIIGIDSKSVCFGEGED